MNASLTDIQNTHIHTDVKCTHCSSEASVSVIVTHTSINIYIEKLVCKVVSK